MTFDEVKQLFLDSRRAVGCTEKTVKWYKHMVTRYGAWLAENSLSFDAVKLVHLQQYIASLYAHYSPNTARQTATALITLYRWALDVELVATNPATKLKRPSVPDEIQPVAARSYTQHMLESMEMLTWLDYRDKLIIQILASTGLRINECVNLKVQDVDLEKRRLAIVGKGGKLRYQPFPDELIAPLREWLEKWRPPVKNSPWMFFATNRGGSVRGPITKQAVYDTMKRHAIRAALDWVPPHGYRRGFAVDMLEHGASTRLVQALLGHASVTTTEKYLRLSPAQVHVEFDKKWEDLGRTPEQIEEAEKPQERKKVERPKPAPPPAAGSTTTTVTFWASGTD